MFLDVKKAFDMVWHAGLLVNLNHEDVTGHLWHLINIHCSSRCAHDQIRVLVGDMYVVRCTIIGIR